MENWMRIVLKTLADRINTLEIVNSVDAHTIAELQAQIEQLKEDSDE